MTEGGTKAGMVVLRLLYLSWLGVLSYWYSLPALDWFALEPDKLGPHHVVSFNFHPFFMSLAVICLMTEGQSAASPPPCPLHVPSAPELGLQAFTPLRCA